MSRASRVFGGVGLGQTHLLVVTVVGLWLTPFLLSRVGAHDFGLWLVALQIVGYLQLLDFGVVGLLPREAAYARGRVLRGEDAGVVAATIARVRGIILWQLPGVAAIAVAGWWMLPSQWGALREPFVWVLLFFVATFPLRAAHAALQGLQDLVFLGHVQIVAWCAGTITLVALVLGGMGLMALAFGWLTTQGLTFAACWWRMRLRHRDAWAGGASLTPWPEARAFFGRAVWVSVAQLAQMLVSSSDVLVVAALLGPAAVVPYSCTAKLAQVLANHPQLLMQSAAPALSEMRMSEGRPRLAAATSALTRAMLVLSGGVACVIVAANEAFVTWWVGAEQYGGLTLTLVLVAAMLARHLNVTTVYAVFCFGHERRMALTSLADGVVTVGASMLLIPVAGLSGAALGGLVGVTAVSFLPNLVVLARELGVRIRVPVLDLRGWFVRFTACAVIATAVAIVPAEGAFWQIAARGATAAAVYGAVMLPFALQGTLGVYIRQLLSGPLRTWGIRVTGAKAA